MYRSRPLKSLTMRPKKINQTTVDKLQQKHNGGSLVEKASNKQNRQGANSERQKLVLSKYNITKQKKNMPLVDFFKFVLQNKAVFLSGYKPVEKGKRRLVIWDLLSFIELTYPGQTLENCASDVECIQHLFSNKKLVTKTNIQSILAELNLVFEQILFPSKDRATAQHSSIQVLLRYIKQNRPDIWTQANDSIWRKIIKVSDDRKAIQRTQQDENQALKLNQVKLYPEYSFVGKYRYVFRHY